MSGDYSRNTFDAHKDYSGVLMQQGRVQLDADWNEFVQILDRRLRAQTVDTIGRCSVPAETPYGFKIELGDGGLYIGRGRMYVDGLLAENHGKRSDWSFDEALAEPVGPAILYHCQPYRPNLKPADLPQEGKYLVYLDVWQRELTAVEEPELIEQALDVDTTTRLQTVWQVRLLDASQATCATPRNQIVGWRPSAGRLTTKVEAAPSAQSLCQPLAGPGYRGSENRCYRVEIHDGGALGKATFKWSRDNASIATSVTEINGATLTVECVGRDEDMRFETGDWIEITDDWREFQHLPGVMRKVQDVPKTGNQILLEESLPDDAGFAKIKKLVKQRHTRVRRWDQNRIDDVNGSHGGSDKPSGLITVPLSDLVYVTIENGIQVKFSLDSSAGEFKTGDYWIFAARDGSGLRDINDSIDKLDQAPPRGIHHHYAPLAMVDFKASAVEDCRTLWPSPGCGCTICVTPDSHASGRLTIQMAIDMLKQRGGGEVCLSRGSYFSDKPVQISECQAIQLSGHDSHLIYTVPGWEAALQIDRAAQVVIRDLTVWSPSPGVNINMCLDVSLDQLSVTCALYGVLAALSAGVTVKDCDIHPLSCILSITAGAASDRQAKVW